MSHTENCIFCYNAVIDVDDGTHILMDHKKLRDLYICINCLNELGWKDLNSRE